LYDSNVVRTGPFGWIGHSTGSGGSQKPVVCGPGKKSFETGSNPCEPVEPMTVLENQLTQILALKKELFFLFRFSFYYA
jgi:hypothetical protein